MVGVFSTFAVSMALVSGDRWKCGNYYTQMECDSFAQGLCHSGTNPECSDQYDCGSNTFAAVDCSDDNTQVDKGASHWLFGSYGQHLSCADETGTAATGACGGGKNPDCNNDYYFGIDCSKNNVHVEDATCEWTYHSWGHYAKCPDDRPILAGSCSGGANPDCNGQYFATQCCAEHSTVNNVVGRWVKISFSSGPQTLTYSAGTQVTNTKSTTTTTGKSVQKSVEEGLEVEGISQKKTVSRETSHSLATMDEHSFSTTYSESYSTTVAAGRVWQWRYDSDLNRGTSSTWSQSLVSTPSDDKPPCCLPGYFQNPTEPNGKCITDSVDLCERSLSV